MSKEIICNECHTANPPGSKYCNHCGSRLPLSTSLICPNCQTPNPRNRFYCDNCGTRLVRDARPAPGEPEPTDQPAESGKIFSLPARPPGDTGELDPSKAVPDWLKGQSESTSDADDEGGDEGSARQGLPRIEEIGAPKKTTADLPEWLIDENDSEPIIGSPPSITTEHYLNLTKEPEDEALSDQAETADLPDWLTDLASPDSGDQVTISDDQSTADDALTEWLASIAPSDEDDVEPEMTTELEAGLAELGQPLTSDSDLADGETPLPPPGEFDEVGADKTLEHEMLGWLSESLSESSRLAPETAVPAHDEHSPAADADDWLDLTSDDTLSNLADAVAQQDFSPPDEALPDWLTDAQTPTSEQPPSPAEPGGTTEQDVEESQPDWMAEFTVSDAPELDQMADATPDLMEETAAGDGEAESSKIPEPEAEAAKPAELPTDWLADLGADGAPDDMAGEAESIVSELFSPDEAASLDLDWLEEEPTAVDETVNQTGEAEVEAPAALDETDWLTELAALGDEAYVEEETAVALPELDSGQPEPPSEPDAVAADTLEEGEEAAPAPEPQESIWFSADTMLTDALEEELPDWLDELGPPVADQSPPEPDDAFVSNDSLPDWIAQMKPGKVQTGSKLSDSSGLPDITEPLPEIPGELIKSDLPDWLQNATDMTGPMTDALLPLEESPDIPDWLKSEGGLTPSESGLPGSGSQPPPDISSEWTAVLQDLPPAQPLQDRLAKAEIPDWILALKPQEDEAEIQEAAPESGPLSGIRGVIDIESVAVQPQGNGFWEPFTVTREQRDQTIWLKQMALAAKAATSSITEAQTAVPLGLRLILAALLVAAIFIGLRRPDLLQRTPLPASPAVEMAYSVVQNTAGRPVLVAVEYTPAMAGELDSQARLLIEQLAANDSPVITVSQYAAGTAVAQSLTSSQVALGFLPGDSTGLRQLGACLADSAACAAFPAGINLTGDTQQMLEEVSLVIVLTGERDSLVRWLEQVGRTTDLPIIAGITQSLGPVAAPYFDSGQLQGVITGLPETAVYHQLQMTEPTDSVVRHLNAQTLAQILAASLLILGGLGYGLKGLIERGKTGQA